MTFCLGLKCQEGLLAIADTRITSGTEVSVGKKISVHQSGQDSTFILTSGLRSLTDKAITYFEERLHREQNLDRMYQAANALGEEVRRVRTEDRSFLLEGGLAFDLHCIFGGQLSGDPEAHLYLIYPDGTWVEVRARTPYVIIGESRYGKPTLDRVWRYEQGLDDALRIALLAFDATKTSTSDVYPPADVVLYRSGSFAMQEERFSEEDLRPLTKYWQAAIVTAVDGAREPVNPLLNRLREAAPADTHYGEEKS